MVSTIKLANVIQHLSRTGGRNLHTLRLLPCNSQKLVIDNLSGDLSSFDNFCGQNSFKMKYVKPLILIQDLVKTKAVQRGRLLGLDVGDKYVGLAVSDSHYKIASPLSVLLRKKTNIDLVAGDLQKLVSELSLVGLVVGYPFDKQRLSPCAVQVKVFVDDLCETGKLQGVKYTYWDESFTSKNVELLLKPLNLHPVHAKTIFDKFAAVGILQGYLDYLNKKAEFESVE